MNRQTAMRHNAAEATVIVSVNILRYLHAFCENLVEFCHPTWQIYVRLFLFSFRRRCNAVSCKLLSERVMCTHACRCCKFADIVAYILFRIASNSTCMRGFSLATVCVGSAGLMQIIRQTVAVSHLAAKILNTVWASF